MEATTSLWIWKRCKPLLLFSFSAFVFCGQYWLTINQLKNTSIEKVNKKERTEIKKGHNKAITPIKASKSRNTFPEKPFHCNAVVLVYVFSSMVIFPDSDTTMRFLRFCKIRTRVLRRPTLFLILENHNSNSVWRDPARKIQLIVGIINDEKR